MMKANKVIKKLEEMQNKGQIGKKVYFVGGLTIMPELSKPKIVEGIIENILIKDLSYMYEEKVSLESQIVIKVGGILKRQFSSFENIFTNKREANERLKQVKEDLINKLEHSKEIFNKNHERRERALKRLKK